jgi:hypothetical protein
MRGSLVHSHLGEDTVIGLFIFVALSHQGSHPTLARGVGGDGGAMVLLCGLQNFVNHLNLLRFDPGEAFSLRDHLAFSRWELIGGAHQLSLNELVYLRIVAGPLHHRHTLYPRWGRVFYMKNGGVDTIPGGLMKPRGDGGVVPRVSLYRTAFRHFNTP